MKKTFSIVVPVYQNEENIDYTVPEILSFIETLSDYECEVVFVNDGSKDGSLDKLKFYQNKFSNYIKVISFTKNFGQKSAIMAGVKASNGDLIGVISCDMQDPIELFKNMLSDIENGKKISIGIRKKRSDGIVSDVFSNSFYYIIKNYAMSEFPKGGFDFWVMDREAAKTLITHYDHNGNIMMTLFGFGYPYGLHQYTRKKREHGKSGYTFFKKIESFYDSFLSNSYVPIRAVTFMGFLSAGFGFVYALYVAVSWLINDGQSSTIDGWATLVVLLSIFSGAILMSLGVIGEYIWRIYAEVRKSPHYIIDEVIDEI